MVVYRIGFPDLNIYESSGKDYKKSKREFPDALNTAKLFKANKTLREIRDSKNKRFLVGEFSNGKALGGKIKILPNKKELSKPFSLFAPNLKIHDEKSNSHWDVIFQNPNGAFSYIYTLEKDNCAKKVKYKKVEEFKKCLPKIQKGIKKDLPTGNIIAIMLTTLLKTNIRIGNEIYYKRDKHKGLTTLQKKDISIKGENVTFEFLAKDGVPMKIREKFAPEYLRQLKKILKTKRESQFVFSDKNNRPFKDIIFERAFENYCGKKFYPHIVRSYYATKKANDFLQNKKEITEGEVRKLYNSIAEKLGHKKFSKKEGKWKDSYQITLHHYINPEIVEKIQKITKKD